MKGKVHLSVASNSPGHPTRRPLSHGWTWQATSARWSFCRIIPFHSLFHSPTISSCSSTTGPEPRHSDAMVRHKMRHKQLCYQAIDPVLCSPQKGGVMSQCGIRAKLCVGKISIDSSIQAQRPGDVMRRKWRSYGSYAASLLKKVVY